LSIERLPIVDLASGASRFFHQQFFNHKSQRSNSLLNIFLGIGDRIPGFRSRECTQAQDATVTDAAGPILAFVA
jgi:hypothetical protein